MLRNYRPMIFNVLMLAALVFQVTTLPAAQAEAVIPDFVKLVKDNSAAVVNINTTEKVKVSGQPDMPFPDMPDNSPFNEFFKRFFQQMPPGVPHDEERQSLGSGFIISPDGYILTNAHVVKDADKINVGLFDHSQASAKVIGMDERTDVALLKIDGHDLPTVKIGDSDKVQVGEWVLAIGSPFGLNYTATHGIVSAVGRTLPDDVYVPFIQTDVAVNPGNSGGPLFNTQGEVVGINSQIYSNTGGYMGLSFAVPINVAMKVGDELKAHGHVTHAWLGVSIQTVDDDLAKSFGLDHAHGALVAEVMANSPAAKAGIRPGDIILSYNGQDIATSSSLPALVGATKVGKTVPLTVWRDGKTLSLQATIAVMNEKNTPTAKARAHKADVMRIRVADLTDQQRQDFAVGKRGILVKEVENGPAEDAGIHQGDVILQMDHKDITSVAEFTAIETKLPRDKPFSILIQRQGSPLFLAATIPK